MRITPAPIFHASHQLFLDAVTPFPELTLEGSITQRFLTIAAKHPEASAIESDTFNLNYRQLNRAAENVAVCIQIHASDTSLPVGLVFEDTALLITAIFGVLKSGRPYLVLDPGYPEERLTMMIRDSGSRQIITQGEVSKLENALLNDEIRHISFEEINVKNETTRDIPDIGPESPALIMYTSGSTGTPRGVVHTHRSILAEIYHLTTSWKIGNRDKLLLNVSCAFASSIRTIFAALLNGATLVCYDFSRLGFTGLNKTIVNRRVTIIRSLPSTFRSYLRSVEKSLVFKGVRLVSLGGETVAPTDVDLFNQHFARHCILVLAYGPTECLTACMAYATHGVSHEDQRVPMGFASPLKRLKIVDTTGNEVAAGEPGELVVSSRYLSAGYWRNIEASEQCFTDLDDGARAFYTGDIVVQNTEASYTHLGRKDFQIKVRGYRIDVFEIENTLRRLPGIFDAVVTAQACDSGDKLLAAFIVPESGYASLSGSAIQNALANHLPAQMIPSLFQFVDGFPYNNNGKLDRGSLPIIESQALNSEANPIINVSGTLAILQSFWSQALGLQQTPLDASFLALGGDSLKAMEVAFKISRHFGIDVSPLLMLRNMTLTQLADSMQRGPGELL